MERGGRCTVYTNRSTQAGPLPKGFKDSLMNDAAIYGTRLERGSCMGAGGGGGVGMNKRKRETKA